jgi:hypothetical protein
MHGFEARSGELAGRSAHDLPLAEKLRFLGMDVYAQTIAAAIAKPDDEVRSLGTIPNRMESVRKLLKKLGPVEKLRTCYEAGTTGYVLHCQLAELGVQSEVIAPSLVSVKAGDRVKTDRRDAEKLARSYRSPAANPDLVISWVRCQCSFAQAQCLREIVVSQCAGNQATSSCAGCPCPRQRDMHVPRTPSERTHQQFRCILEDRDRRRAVNSILR